MEAEIQHHNEQIIEISGEVSTIVGTGSNRCSEAPCGFSDSVTSSKDASERSASMRKLFMAVALCVVFMSVEVVGGIEANSLAILTDAAHLLSDVAAFAISLFSLWAAGWEATPRQTYGFFRLEILGALISIQLIWLLAGILVYEAIVRIIQGTTEVNGFLMFIVAAFGLLVNIIMAVLLGHDHGHGHSHSHGHEEDDHDDHTHDNHKHNHTARLQGNEHHDSQEDATQPLLKLKKGSIDEMIEPKQETSKKKKRNINVQGAYLHVLGDSIQSVG